MIRIGPAGWAYKDWEGIVYPKPRGFDPVTYLARFFDTIKINSSFYGPPRQAAMRASASLRAQSQSKRATLRPVVRKWPPAPDEIGRKDGRQNRSPHRVSFHP